MKTFMHKLQDPLGLNSRHAGVLVKEAGKYRSSVTVICGENHADGKRIMKLMMLKAKQDDVLAFLIEGPDEATATYGLRRVVQDNF